MNRIKFAITIILLSVIAVYSQTFQELQQRRTKEHEAIKDFISRIAPSYPVSQAPVQGKSYTGRFEKSVGTAATGTDRRKHYFMNGNRVQSEIYNYGGIAPGYDLLRGVNNGVWRGSSYIFQFCPLIGAAVHPNGDTTNTIHIISDALFDYPNLREVNPATGQLWTFEPITGYSDPNSDLMASNPAVDADKDGKPDSWPREWYNPTLGKYVWPGYLEQDAENADLEVFWAMDDRNNKEFPYYPFPSDTNRKGLGVQIDGRALQWSNTLAENSIFFVYTVSNVSEKNLDSVYFGIYGDCDVGGGSPENTDDNGFFVPPFNFSIPVYARSMVYFWDPDGVGALGIKVGYVACKFLESPGNPTDNIDNDGDMIVDERQDDGIDNDGDWNPATDDVGIDGIPNTNDFGEGDGLPTAGRMLASGARDPLFPGEPNFEFTDLDEADQNGLTSFNSWTWNADKVSNDESMWNRLKAGNFGDIIQSADIVFIFGSGVIKLAKQETKRISMSLLFGENLDDLLTSAETVQRIYNANYRFFKPPKKPVVSAIGDDKKVTLYWDAASEESRDPLTGKDFEGYVIYRSTDPNFGDIQTITDGRGSAFFSAPLKDLNGNDARFDVGKRDEPYTDTNNNGRYDTGEPYTDINLNGRWDAQIEDWWKGYHLVSFQGRGIQYYLGNNRGLVHSYVDSNNVINGQTYYYAVVAYDHGDSTGVPPTETTKKITYDPVKSTYEFDVNTVQVIPGPRASGYSHPVSHSSGITQVHGTGNGSVKIDLLNDLELKNNLEYEIFFGDTVQTAAGTFAKKNYSILRKKEETEEVVFYGDNFFKLNNSHIDRNFTVVVKSPTGTLYNEGPDYVIDYTRGLIRRSSLTSPIPDSSKATVTYRYHPVWQSTLLNLEDGNAAFDGLRVRVYDHKELALDTVNTRWSEGTTNYKFNVSLTVVGVKKAKYPADYEITFSDTDIDSAKIPFGATTRTIPTRYTVKEITYGVPRRLWTLVNENPSTRNNRWDVGEEIIFFTPYTTATTSDTVTWSLRLFPPTDTTITPKPPGNGDKLLILTQRPFNNSDRFTFKSQAGSYSNEKAKSMLDNVFVVPNPYIGYNELEPTNKLPGKTRGERRIYFENLPMRCTIRIYTLAGEFVKLLEHDSYYDNGREFWNLLNEDGFSVAYGVYFAHIDAPGVGEKLIKFALIK